MLYVGGGQVLHSLTLLPYIAPHSLSLLPHQVSLLFSSVSQSHALPLFRSVCPKSMALDAVDRTKEEGSASSPSMQRIWVKRKRSERRRAGSSNTAAATAVVEEARTEEEDLAVILMMLSRDRSSGSGSGSAVPPPPPPPFDLDSNSGDKLVYSCSICGKAFDSYQALGGHKTSHRKPAPGDVDAAAAAASGVQQQEKVHQCLICLKTFPSGQALGGHKRKHYEGPALKMKLDLDLNMPPAPEEEAAEEEEINPEAKKQRLLISVDDDHTDTGL